MKLLEPFRISARLLPALEIGGATMQLEYAKRSGAEGRARYHWIIDLADGRMFQGEDLQSGACGGTLQEGFQSLLSFLGAFAESIAYTIRERRVGEHARLFPTGLAKWAVANSDEISSLAMELEERAGELILE